MSLTDIILWFFVYGFSGWFLEVIFMFVTTKKLINRGFLNGPICPIYGFGAVILVSTLQFAKGNIILLFIGGFLLASVLEYVASFVLEKVFNTKWWDYSDLPYNLRGRICLKFSVYWGILSVVLLRIIHPFIKWVLDFIDSEIKPFLVIFLLVILSIDFIVTVWGVLKLNERLSNIHEIFEKIHENYENFKDKINLKSDLQKKYKLLLSKKTYVQNRLIQAFPKIKSIKFPQALSDLKEYIKKAGNNGNNNNNDDAQSEK